MYSQIFLVHKYSVLLFLLIYVVKLGLLLAGKDETLAKVTKAIKVPEMIVSTLFLLSGIYLIMYYPFFNLFLIIKLVAVFASIPLAIIGFKKKKKVLAILGVALIFVAYGLAEMNKKLAPKKQILAAKSTQGEAVLPEGQLIYEQGCAPCHGKEGNAGIAGAANLQASTLTEEETKLVIVKGRKSMPAFGYLSEEELGSVITYLKGLKK